jgi:hypothetical protein
MYDYSIQNALHTTYSKKRTNTHLATAQNKLYHHAQASLFSSLLLEAYSPNFLQDL